MRSWSIPLGKLFGVDVRVHVLFAVLLAYMVVAQISAGGQPGRACILATLMLVSVLLHEMAEIAAAAGAGAAPRLILLLPFGGIHFGFVADSSAQPASRRRGELRAALAGPAINLLLAMGAGFAIAARADASALWQRPLVDSAALLRSCFWINLALGAFNLLPAYPLDGGRVLRAFLAGRLPVAQATRRAAAIGHVFSIALLIVGFWNDWQWLLVLGLFLVFGAFLEERKVAFEGLLEQVRMEDVMLTDFSVLSPADTLQDALQKAVHTLQDDFPVVRGSDLVGTISRHNIVRALRSEGNGYVQRAMNRAFDVAGRRETVASAFHKIAFRRGMLIPVVEEERLVGIVTMQNLMHSISLLAESQRQRREEED
jgi:Zn-dependent protease